MEVDESNEQHVEYKVDILKPNANDNYIIDDDNILHCVKNKPFYLTITDLSVPQSERYVNILILDSQLKTVYRCQKHIMEDENVDTSIMRLLIRFLNEHSWPKSYCDKTGIIKTILNKNEKINKIALFVTCSHECLKQDICTFIGLLIGDEKENIYFTDTHKIFIHESKPAMNKYVANKTRQKIDNSTLKIPLVSEISLKIPSLSEISFSFEQLEESNYMASEFLEIILNGPRRGIPRMGHHLQKMVYALREYNVTIPRNGNEQKQTEDNRH